MNKQYIVIDLDTTIADNTHREHHVKDGKNEWNAFFEKMIDDAVYPCVNAVVQSMHKSGYGIIVLTARHVRYRMYTVSWLLKNDIPYDRVIMKDTTPNQERAPYFKLRALETLKAEGYNILFCLEDQKNVTELLRLNGHTVFNVRDSHE